MCQWAKSGSIWSTILPPEKALALPISYRDNDSCRHRTLRSCGSGSMPCAETGNQLSFGGRRRQKNSRRLDKAVTAENKSAIYFRQFNQGIVDVRVSQHAVVLFVTLNSPDRRQRCRASAPVSVMQMILSARVASATLITIRAKSSSE
jgi:hypothetical protein